MDTKKEVHVDVDSKKSRDRQEERGKDRDVKPKDNKRQVPVKDQKKFKLLENELFCYNKDRRNSSDSSESEEEKVHKRKSPPPPKVLASKEAPKKEPPHKKKLQALENELFKYHKDRFDESSDDSNSDKEPVQIKKEPVQIEKNGKGESLQDNTASVAPPTQLWGMNIAQPPTETRPLFDSSSVKIPGICDSNEDSPDHEMNPFTSVESLSAPSKVFELLGKGDGKEKILPVKEKRRWDMQEADTKKKVIC